MGIRERKNNGILGIEISVSVDSHLLFEGDFQGHFQGFANLGGYFLWI